MILQILGVALISLLTITPTIQQNNIPNITVSADIINDLPTQFLVTVPFDYYYINSSQWYRSPSLNDISAQAITNPNVDNYADTDLPSTYDNGVIVQFSNFYFYSTTETAITGTQMRQLISKYYNDTRGGTTTSTNVTVSWTETSAVLFQGYYTYTISATQGAMSGNVYYLNMGEISVSNISVSNNNITVNQNISINQIINNINPTQTLSNLNGINHQIITYYFNQPIDTTQIGTVTRTLYGRTNYLKSINYGTITINITQADTTPPTITGSNTIQANLGIINNDNQLISVFTISDNVTTSSAITKVLTGTRNYSQAGTYNLTLTATDAANNQATKQFTFIINPPIIDTEPPLIVSDLIVSFTIGDFTDRQDILDFYTTVTDNYALSSVLLVGNIDFNAIGDYQLQIIATDTSQNQSTRNILLRIRNSVDLSTGYNPLTDLLSGIFGGALSMIFTIGTVNILGLRLLDAMGVIILGAVLLFVYKAIKGGS